MKHNRFRFLTSIALVFMLCVSTVMPVFADTPITKVFAASDYQAKTGDAEGEEILGAIIDAMINDGHTSVDGALYAGDYDYNMPSDTSHGIISIKNVFNSKWPSLSEDNMVFVQGNHDPASTPGITPSGANDTEDYGVFVINEGDYMWYNSDRGTIEKTANNLENYLGDKLIEGYSKPIFVVSHLPLHYSMRTRNDGDTQYANLLFDVLNEAGANGLNIIFLFGHDHSNGWDDYLGGSCIYLAKGDSINIAQSSRTEFKAETLNFTYMNPGYTGYYNQVNSGVEATLTSTVFTIYENRVEINRYSANGTYNLKSEGVRNAYKNESGYDVDTRVVTGPGNLELNTVKAMSAVKIVNEGKNIIPVGGAAALTAEISNITDPIFDWSSSNSDILSVEGNGDNAVVYAVGEGSATINLTVTDGNDSTTTSTSYSATAIDTANSNVYELVNKVDQIESGNKYFMIFTDSRDTLPKYSAVTHEVMTNGGRTGLVPKDIGLTSDVAHLTGDYSSYEWTFTGSNGSYVISCDSGVLSIGNSNVNLNGSADHIIKITDGLTGLYFTDSTTNYQLSDSSKGMFSGYSNGEGKQFSLYRNIDIVEAPGEPQNLSVVSGNQTVTLSWDVPKTNGGNAITGYQVSCDGLTWVDTVDNSYTFTNLTNNTAYTFYVRAVNSKGAGITANIIGTPVAKDPEPGEIVNKLALSIAVEMANNVTDEQLANVVPAVVNEFKAALQEATVILADDSASQEVVDASFARLSVAMHMLEFVKGDKSALEALINEANNYVEENYTPDSWTAFKEALDAAIEVMNDENALEADVVEALNNLKDAMTSLVIKVDKTKLQEAYDKVNGLDKSLYTEGSVANLAEPMANAKAVLDDADATQEAVDAVYEALIRAYLDLRLIPNKDLLQELINKAETLNVTNYSAKTWSVMVEALDEAKAVLNDPEATQEQVDNAKDVLTKAMAGLEVNEASNPVKAGDTTASVATGDDSLIGLFAGVGLLSMATVLTNRKRKEN